MPDVREAIRVEPGEVRTARLRLVALDSELLRLQQADRAAFFERLGAQPEPAWPPEFDDDAKMRDALSRIEAAPGETGWGAWVFLMAWSPETRDRIVGVGGFHGPPDAEGTVEVACSMLPSFREQGLATEAVDGLLARAFRDPSVKRVRAETPDYLLASRRVLEKAGFAEIGSAAAGEGEAIRYERVRPAD
ncbi:GNAT family N-acetyltransferase [Marinicauda salina]|uniref:GNAT family N-acetyltransferase n=1 Tax=Marinicauda salina TaxID=2135793 RepID=A0A2U2BY36_9PROT|nr:GNAT family N-acetyltransferase [Marinicauda salina]PWE18920.1 GNAT family N-acetyltransferase [Marinicauda salina]